MVLSTRVVCISLNVQAQAIRCWRHRRLSCAGELSWGNICNRHLQPRCTIAATVRRFTVASLTIEQLCTTPWSRHLQQQLHSCRSVRDMEQRYLRFEVSTNLSGRLPLRTLPDRGQALATLLRLTLHLVALNPRVRPSAMSAYSLLY